MGPRVAMVTFDCADPRRLAEFWAQALDVDIDADYGDFVQLGRSGAAGVALGFQRVPDRQPGKNRVHIDLRGSGTRDVSRLVGLGASVLSEHQVPGLAWTVLADPEGNVFCVGEEGS